MATESKAARIRRLLSGDMTVQQIASEVGCLQEYVRVVRQRALDANYSKRFAAYARYLSSSKRKETSNNWRRKRCRTDPEYRAKKATCNRAWYLRKKARVAAEASPDAR